MFKVSSFRAVLVAALLTPAAAVAGQFVIELEAPFKVPSDALMQQAGVTIQTSVTIDEILSAGPDSYVVMTANDADAVRALLQSVAITPEKISEVLYINSPTVGGGEPAGPVPRDGHQVYVIERPIPGVGSLALEIKQEISKGSNAAIAKLGDVIEWDHSYLTSEGTYCVYRAENADTIREHAAIAGAPVGKITSVSQRRKSSRQTRWPHR